MSAQGASPFVEPTHENLRKRTLITLAVVPVILLMAVFATAGIEGALTPLLINFMIFMYLLLLAYCLHRLYAARCKHCEQAYFVSLGVPWLFGSRCRHCRQPG